MSLTEYKKKRSFKKTPEPKGGRGTGNELRFVIQKHDATHLHYDFRLEMEGVLKSWAVPKGPSTDPEIKRLAMMVEDHPYDYRNFEGIIPEEQYGGGTVIIRDEGTYMPFEADSDDLQKQEKQVLQQLKAGKLKFVLKGKKLKGAYALVKAYGRGDNGWLLMKWRDKYAQDSDILLKDKSVVSGKTVVQIERNPDQKAEKLNKALEKQVKSIAPIGDRLKSFTLVNRELPKTTGIERVVADRKGKIYLDFLQNRDQATIAAPYSIRPKPGAAVSMPLHWDEVKKDCR